MSEKEDVMRVTIHAAHLKKDETNTPLAALLLQKTMRTIEQFESRGWHADVVDQDDVAATITFRRPRPADVQESTLL